MSWKLVYLPESAKDLKNLAGNQRLMIVKVIGKVLQNLLPVTESGYGKLLGNKHGNDLASFLKIKLRDIGSRVMYKRIHTEMLVVAIGQKLMMELMKRRSTGQKEPFIKNSITHAECERCCFY